MQSIQSMFGQYESVLRRSGDSPLGHGQDKTSHGNRSELSNDNVSRGHGYGHRHHGPDHEGFRHNGRQVFNTAISYQFSASFTSVSFSSSVSGTRLPDPAESEFTFEPPSPADVANNVLKFVEQRLSSEAESGASQERLSNLLSQAREGIEKGFAEARDQLESMGLMNEELGAEIDDSYNRIADGLNELEGRFTGSLGTTDTENLPVPPTEEKNEQSVKSEGESEVSRVGNTTRYAAGYEKFVGFNESLSLDVKTQDGDTVRVYFNEMGASFKSGGIYANGEGQASFQQSALMSASQYQFSVEGELDEGELEALNALFSDVDELAGMFFGGDLEQAFNAALELGFDGEELAGFSLNLTQTQVSSVALYESVGGGRNPEFEPLGQVVSGVRDALNHAQAFASPRELVKDLFDDVFSASLKSQFAELDLIQQENQKKSADPFSRMVHQLIDFL
ncbi:MAG: DUF5610 domain-containing protein [Pseudomonadales bacterium]|nr:DUF5610 domain-containing protein [Pseudomonadales bacterium]